MYKEPLITIILTTFNRAHLISETLDSIISQTYTNWKCLIIDDNSKDNTNKVVNKYLKKDNRFHYYLKGDKYVKGLSASRNMGMDLIKRTEFIQFFDDDDIMHPQKFEIQVAEFLKYKDLDLTIFPTVNFKNDEKIEVKKIKTKLDSELINIAKEFIFAKKQFTAQVPLIKYTYIKGVRFNELLFYAEEWEFFNQLFFSKKTNASFINIPLYFHRKHDLSITANLYGKSNLKEISKNLAYLNVYNVVKKSQIFNGKIFSIFITSSLYNKYDVELLSIIKKDLKKELFKNKFKNSLILFLIPIVNLNKRIIIKLIQRIARW
jgi:glycosyltransferase involved in cell wall biosynthesis